ncbi:Urb2/Npa2 family-domain-containing protein [Neohortaea acidophila]|uniref:Urb2/Npa2 family-domain-containing protein n=1 Tax=Neohortaea acidophila TaxID=245834 RepID=A0A6A6PW30_9PEZI|nr:Urb2/Npa2 family-domain-containing protein [Neohortaea acidophila]KAF2483944.1 Urb2/Npa2 family-domain-containing protein [Neohortaea acidophila]
MGGLLTDEQPSLDRLKDLDVLPDLETQLSVVHQLCTHSARAEMIARWLLEKLKASQEARSNPKTWNELLFTIRLLSPQRLASLLGLTNFFDTVGAALQNPECPRSVVEAITALVSFLISVAASPDGLHVKAALSLSASIAASLLGLWLDNAAHIAATQKKKSWIQAVDAVLEPAFYLWNVRKPAEEEHAAFAKVCLAPGARLLALSLNCGDARAVNRKRRIEEENDTGDHVDTLQTLLARHVFMPARSAFFQSGSAAATHPQRTGTLLPHHMSLEAALELYKVRMDSDDADGLLMLEALPALLDIALRSVSLSTPRQRTKEQPWIEAVFAALQKCNQDASDVVRRNAVLVDMLKVTGARASLSRAMLEGIVNSASNLATGKQTPYHGDNKVDWNLVAQIVELDAELFCRPDLANRLFNALSAACADLQALEAREKDQDTSSIDSVCDFKATQQMWKQRIAMPIMQAFAKSRKMSDFLDLWSNQLRQHEDSLIWTELDRDFQDNAEDGMPEQALLELFNRLSTRVKDGANSSDFGPSIIILNALLGNIRSESLRIRLEPRCGELFVLLFQVCAEQDDPEEERVSHAAHQPRIWALLLKTFELWFPSWAATQTDASVVSQKLCQWTTSDTVTHALQLAQWARDDGSDTKLKQQANEAVSFVAGMWSAVADSARSHDSSESAFSAIVDHTLDKLESGHSTPLLHYPHLLAIIDEDMRRELVTRCMPESSAQDQEQVLAVLKKLAAVAVDGEHAGTILHLVDRGTGTAAELEGTVRSNHAASPIEDIEQELDLLDALLNVPIDIIDEMHRKRLLDELCVAGRTSSASTDDNLQLLLGVIIKLLSRPTPTAQLLTDPSIIWQLALQMSATEYIETETVPGPIFQQQETLDLLEHVTLLVMNQVVANQQGNGRSIVENLSREAQAMLSYVGRSQDLSSHTAVLVVSRSIMQGLESGCKPDVLHSLPHRTLEDMSLEEMVRITKAFTSDLGETLSLMATLERTSTNYLEVAMRLTSLSRTLTLLLDLWESTSKFVQPFVPRLASVIKHLGAECTQYHDGFKKSAPSAVTGAVVSCYLLLRNCDHPDYGILDATVALQLPEFQLPPVKMQQVIEAFEKDLKRMSGYQRLALVPELLDHEASTRSNLLLLHSCISKLTKEDSVGSTEAALSRLLPELVDTAVNNDGDLVVRKRAVACILTILKEKPFLVNQHSIEIVLASLPKLPNAGPGRSLAFFEVCRLVSVLLLGHRARLHGRYHLVNLVFNSLLSALFDNSSASTNRPKGSTPFNQTHAHALSRLLVLFCEPAHLRRSSRSTAAAAGLVDESRKEQALVGRFVQYILHHYCDLVLAGSLGEGVREALTPGLWAVIDAVESSDSEGLKALSAAMNNNERAVLKGVYEEWKRFGKWRGG